MTEDNGAKPHIATRVEGHVGILTVSNPRRRNAINRSMWAVLPAIMANFEADPEVYVVMVRGSGSEAFSAGADISEFAETRGTVEAAKAYDAVNAKAYAAVRETLLPTVAMIHGFCYGGGLGLAACCDLRLGSTDSSYSVPAGRLGLAYPTASLRHLTNIAGPSFAKELLFTGRGVPARRAYEAGFLNRLVEAEDLEAEATALCAQIADNAPLTVRAAKYLIDAAAWAPESIDEAQVRANADACYNSEDYQEGRRAFMEKRKPVFRGR